MKYALCDDDAVWKMGRTNYIYLCDGDKKGAEKFGWIDEDEEIERI